MVTQPGLKNPNWKGGRTLASNGYVLLKRPDHPAADCRGYIYEHRLVAEEKIGRPLRDGEEVHHLNGNKQDNRSENLLVAESAAAHQVHHRRIESGRRMPREANPVVPCGCGCGTALTKYDASGRPRAYVSGHNPQEAPRRQQILQVLASGPKTRAQLAMACSCDPNAIAVTLSKLRRDGLAHPVKHGVWATADTPVEITTNPMVACACGCGKTFPKYDALRRPRRFKSGHNARGEADG